MPKNFIIPLHVYPFDVMVSIAESDDELLKHFNKYGIDKKEIDLLRLEENGRGRAVMLASNQSIIRLWKMPKTNEDYGVLQHEIFHIVSFIMKRVGMKLKIKTSCEAYAYLIGYLTKKIYERL